MTQPIGILWAVIIYNDQSTCYNNLRLIVKSDRSMAIQSRDKMNQAYHNRIMTLIEYILESDPSLFEFPRWEIRINDSTNQWRAKHL